MTQIIGIFLVKNEDFFIKKSVENVVDFCDKIILLDNNSTDATYDILEKIQKKFSNKIELHRLEDALQSHNYIEKYANTETWIFAVDGDEIYDLFGLKKLRGDLLSGSYNNYWKIFGNCLHVDNFNESKKTVSGYLCPPSRSITKLYNFNAIYEWKEYTERLHGEKMKFKPDFSKDSVLKLFDNYKWENSPFRCLHMCFIKRSSQDIGIGRFNPTENTKWYFPIINTVRNLFNKNFSLQSSYKLNQYKKGEHITFNYNEKGFL